MEIIPCNPKESLGIWGFSSLQSQGVLEISFPAILRNPGEFWDLIPCKILENLGHFLPFKSWESLGSHSWDSLNLFKPNSCHSSHLGTIPGFPGSSQIPIFPWFWVFSRRFLRETLKMSNAEDLNRLTACSLVLLGHIFYVLGNHRVIPNPSRIPPESLPFPGKYPGKIPPKIPERIGIGMEIRGFFEAVF